MNKSSKRFEEEKIGNLLLKISIPLIISILISELYNMVDTFFVGRNVGGQGIGALVLVFPIQRIIIALSFMIATGASTAFSRANGQKDIEKSRKIVNNGFSLSIGIMITLTTIILLFLEKILIALGASSQILPYAKDYLNVVILGSTFLSLSIFISNIMISLGDNKVAIISNAIGATVNIILDYILVVHMKIGVKGAAIATTVSQIIGFIYTYYYYRNIKEEYNIRTGLRFNKKIIIPILLVGISAFIVEAEDAIVIALFNNLLLNTVGDQGIVVLGIITKIYMFLFITMFGIASAMQPIAAYNVGAQNYLRLKEVVKKTVIYALITSGFLWALSMIFTPQLISIFVKEKDIIEESITAFRIMVAVFPLISIYYISIFYYQALGESRISILVSIFRQLTLMIPIAIVLVKVFNLGAMGVWISYPIADILSSIVSFILIKREVREMNYKIKE
ncbi:MAG TPA: MATE family efflux transporter [Tissierellaceae bacterium]|nr:MATE family efflux transporter [Tissierellaceae bacterium]